MPQYFSDIIQAITGNPNLSSVYSQSYDPTEGPPVHLDNYGPPPLPEQGVDVIANPMLTIPTPRYEGEPPQMLEPSVVLADPLDDFQAKADEGMLKTADTASPGFLSRFMGAGSNKDFNRMLLAAGAGMLSKPGAQGLGQAAANVGEVADAIQKREDDAALKQAKIAKMYADMKKGAKTTSDGMGGVWVTPADGSPPYRLTDDEFRQAKMGNLNSQSQMNTAKLEKLKQEIARGAVPKFIQKIGDDAVLVQKPDGTFETLSTPEMQAAGLRMNNGKLERANAMAQYKFDNQPLSAAEQRDLREIDKAVSDTQSKLSELRATRDRLNDPKLNDEMFRQGAALIPFGNDFAQLMGWDEATTNQMLESLKVDAWLADTAFLKGAISDAENKALKAPMPKTFASKKTLMEWMAQREKTITKMYEGLQRIKETDYRNRGRPSSTASSPARGSENVVPRGSSQAAPLPSEPSSPPPRIDGLDEEAMKYLK